MTATELAHARQELVLADLLAYQPPLYQVLSVPDVAAVPPVAAQDSQPPRAGQAQSAGDILRRILQSGGTGGAT